MANHSSPIETTRKNLVDDVESLKRDAGHIVDDAKAHVRAHVDARTQKITDTVQAARDYAESHPLAVLGIGVAIGFLLAVRVRR
jgi:ElaB/YqjD/DUF883 family membrane-anchored ribosome-binding protein